MIWIFAAINVVLSVFFWYEELKPFLHATRSAWTINMKWLKFILYVPILGALVFSIIGLVLTALKATAYVLINIGKLIPFAIDVFVTLFAVANLGLGAGVAGGMVGLFLSNCVSVIIWRKTKEQRKGIRLA